MVSKIKYINGCQILAEITMEQTRTDRVTGCQGKNSHYRISYCFGLSLSYGKDVQDLLWQCSR